MLTKLENGIEYLRETSTEKHNKESRRAQNKITKIKIHQKNKTITVD